VGDVALGDYRLPAMSEHGQCRICGGVGRLTEEHIPPKGAFNKARVSLASFEEALALAPGEQLRGNYRQGGHRVFSLCATCNNNTGSWYGSPFVRFVHQIVRIISGARGPRAPPPVRTHPARVLKQIAAMFMSVNGVGFRDANPDLVSFILNKDHRLAPKFRFFLFLTRGGGYLKFQPLAARVSFTRGAVQVFSEIVFPPLGYILTFDTDEAPAERLCDITWFGGEPYSSICDVPLRLPVLETYSPLPGDYAPLDQLKQRVEQNKRDNGAR
jgi:hypothetical protein